MLKCFNAKIKKSGFTLLEVIIAIVLVLVGITGTFALITKTMGIMAISSSQLTAIYLSQEGIEIVRNIRDTNWIEHITNPTNLWDEGLNTPECIAGCEADYTATTIEDPTLNLYDSGRFLYIDINDIDGDGITNFYRYIDIPGPDDIQTKFKRKITVAPNGSDILEVNVLIEWEEKGKTYSHTVQENLYNWR